MPIPIGGTGLHIPTDMLPIGHDGIRHALDYMIYAGAIKELGHYGAAGVKYFIKKKGRRGGA